MNRRQRLRGAGLRRLRRTGSRVRRGPLHARALPGGSDGSRAAVGVSGVRSAVARNRLRRRLRAVLAPALRETPVPLDVMLVATAAASTLAHASLCTEVRSLLRDASLRVAGGETR